MDVDRERPKKRLRIPRLHRTRKRRRNYVEVKDEDLIWTTWSERLPRVLLAWSFGFIGTFFLWLGLAIMYPIFADWPYTLLVLEIVVSSILAVTAWGRDTLMRKLADRGFVPTFIVQKILDWAYYLAFPLALYPYLSIKGAIPGVSPPLPIYSTLPLIALGLFFFMLTPHFIFLRFLWPIREARLSLLQFLRDWDRGRSTLPLVASRNARSRNTIALFWTRTQSWNLVSWSELFSLQGESHEQ